MKKARRRIDVNLEELDRVLDGARQAPLSEADHGKLKDTLHALAAMLVRSRNTEKTSEVVGKPEDSETGQQLDDNTPPPPGHGRSGEEATCTGRKSQRCWCGSSVRRRWRLRFTHWSGCAAAPAGRCSRHRSRKEWGRISTMKQRRQ